MSETANNENGSPYGHEPHGTPEFEPTPANALPLTAAEDRRWATLAHFGGILGFIPSLIVYLVFHDRGPFTAQESKEALNFTLPPTILAFMTFLLSLIPVVGGVFAVLNALIWVGMAVYSVAAGVHVNRGLPYQYTFNLRLFR